MSWNTCRRPLLHGAAILSLVSAQVAGCATDPGAQELAAAAIAQSAGIEGAVAFHLDGGPLDVPDDAPPAHAWTLHRAVERALRTDSGLQAALARVRIAMADADQSRLLPNPILNVIFRFPSSGSTQVELSLAQDIVSLLKRPGRIAAAESRLLSTIHDAVTAALDVVEETQSRYLGVQALDALVPVLEERRAIIGRMLGIAQDRLAVGEGIRSDVTTLDAQRVELEVDFAETVRLRRVERIRLARLLAAPSSPAEWTLEPWRPQLEVPADEGAWIRAALSRRPEVQAIVHRLAALGDEASLASLSAYEGAGAGVDAERDTGGDWTVGPGASLPIPLFDFGQARRARAGAEALESRHLLSLARRRVVEDVRVALSSFTAASANLQRVRQELVPLLSERRDQAEAAFLGGQTDATPLFLAEQDLRAARAKAIETERLVATAVVRLYRAVGGPGVAVQVAGAAPREGR